MVLYYHALTWQSEATWQRADGDTWTRVCACVRDTHVCGLHVCADFINGLGASVIGFKLTA